MDKVTCRYWLRVLAPPKEQGPNNPYFPFTHEMVKEIKWSGGWGGVPKLNNEIHRQGPYATWAELMRSYNEQKSSLPGAHNCKLLDNAADSHCLDQA